MDKIITDISEVFNSKIRYSILDSVINDINNNPLVLKQNRIDYLIVEKFSIVLKYYLLTRDSKLDYSYPEIYEKYMGLVNINLDDYPSIKKNIVDDGYLTSCFNGCDYELAKKYGLDYISSANEEERKILNKGYNSLVRLENKLGSNEFGFSQEKVNESRTIYLSSPGFYTIQYAMRQSPERLYNGVLKHNSTKFIVGETKEEYIRRSLQSKINNEFYKDDIDNVVSTYCTKNPCISFIKIGKILDIPIAKAIFNFDKAKPLKDVIDEYDITYINEILSKGLFSSSKGDLFKQDRFNDMVSIGASIPIDAIDIISIPDLFDLKQDLALMLGYSIGDEIDPNFNDYLLRKKDNNEK